MQNALEKYFHALENMFYVAIAVSSLFLQAPIAFFLQAIVVSFFNMSKTEKTENYIELILPFYMVFLAAIQPYGNIKLVVPNAWFYDF